MPKLSGRSYAPVLRGEELAWETKIVYEMESCRSIRTEDWKYVARHSPEGPYELYDMQADPHERFNLYGQPEHAAMQEKMATLLDDFFFEYADPQYDIWNGGRSKFRRLVPPE